MDCDCENQKWLVHLQSLRVWVIYHELCKRTIMTDIHKCINCKKFETMYEKRIMYEYEKRIMHHKSKTNYFFVSKVKLFFVRND